MKNTKNVIACLSVLLSVVAGNALAARNSWLYVNSPYYGGYRAELFVIDGTVTNGTPGNLPAGMYNVSVGTNYEIVNAANAGFGKAIFTLTGAAFTRAYEAVAVSSTQTNALTIFSSSNPWAVTSSAGELGAVERTEGGFFDVKSNLTSHDGTNWSTTTLISQTLQRGCAIGGSAGLYVTPSAAYAGTRWISSAGDAQLSATAASGCASTEGGALYYFDGIGSFYIDESGAGAGPLSGGSGGIGIGAVVSGGALVNVGGVAKVWDDLSQTLAAIDFGSGTNDEMTVVVALGNDALIQTSTNGMFYYNSSADSVVSIPDATMIAGASGGDFAYVRLDYDDDTQDGSYFYKDTGSGTMIRWAYRIVDGTNHAYEDIYGVGGYSDIPETPDAFPISIEQPFSGFVEIKWPTVATIPYQVQYKPNLVSGGWSNLGSVVTGNGDTNSYYDSTAPAEGFYQVIIP